METTDSERNNSKFNNVMDNSGNESNVNFTNENKLNSTKVLLLEDEPLETMGVVILCVVGVFAQCCVVNYMRKAENRKPPFPFLINFIIADVLLLVSTLPMLTNILDTPDRSLFGDFVCMTLEWFCELAVAAILITLISLNLFIYFDVPEPPATLLNRFLKSNITVVVSLIWTLAGIIALPTILITHEYFYSNHTNLSTEYIECETVFSRHLYANAIIRFLVYYVIPIVASIYIFVLALVNNKRNGYVRSVQQREFSTVVLLMIITTIIFFSPSHISALLLSFYKKDYTKFWTNYYNVNSAMNFLFRTFNLLALSYYSIILLGFFLNPVCRTSNNQELWDENEFPLVHLQPLEGQRGIVPGPEQPLQQGA